MFPSTLPSPPIRSYLINKQDTNLQMYMKYTLRFRIPACLSLSTACYSIIIQSYTVVRWYSEPIPKYKLLLIQKYDRVKHLKVIYITNLKTRLIHFVVD